MRKYLEHVVSDFDRGELRYLELIDAFGVKGVHWRLQSLREAIASNAKASIIAQKRRFIDDTESMGKGLTKNSYHTPMLQQSKISA
ncbi:unnamed protein product, partial [marine sediment metagenome]